MASMNRKKKILLIGGTKRAVNTLSSLVERTDVDFVHAIFMQGYPEEFQYAEKLCSIAGRNNLTYEVKDKIDDETMQHIRKLECDAFLGIGVWRSLLSDEFLNLARYGFLALHGTPLPRYRGFAGIYWQIINGNDSVALRGLRLASDIDDGPLIVDETGSVVESFVDLNNEMHLEEILDVYESCHIKMLHKILDIVRDDSIGFISQDHSSATYSCHRGPEDAEINWNLSTKEIFNFIRGQSLPLRGAYTYYLGKKVRLWRVKPRYDFCNYEGRICGKVVQRDLLSGKVAILTKDGAIEVIEAEVENSEGSFTGKPAEIFSSIRKRCTSETEAFIFNLQNNQSAIYDVININKGEKSE